MAVTEKKFLTFFVDAHDDLMNDEKSDLWPKRAPSFNIIQDTELPCLNVTI